MTLISKEIKPLAQAVLELYLSEGISKFVSKQASKPVENKKFLKLDNYFMVGFKIVLKIF